MGRAYEYALAINFSEHLPAPISDDSQVKKAKACFDLCDATTQNRMMNSAREAVYFLAANDDRLSDSNCVISIQPDRRGILGDVRDILVINQTLNTEIGISAKHRHSDIKHSRLSETIDFGLDWLGISCSDAYIEEIKPIFRELRNRKHSRELWRDIPDKRQKYYLPILQAFAKELQRLFNESPSKVAAALIGYLLGRHDFYKVIKQNGTTAISSFNLAGTLKWGKKISMPTQIINIGMKAESETTLEVIFNKGWQISFRIHNASTKVEPSLKFAISIIGLPLTIARNEIIHVVNPSSEA